MRVDDIACRKVKVKPLDIRGSAPGAQGKIQDTNLHTANRTFFAKLGYAWVL